ncbi:MAG TPA: GxxExxY protein [Chitinophagaceae bacterium]|jgi:GxxExxY protein|nr:GxxExxY protein [Chitinophagaceae bacterium]HMU58560.1 GxxExxY protein [Chitinophagaceae bacterium]
MIKFIETVILILKVQLMEINSITEKIIGCAIEVHKQLGPGMLESAYEECLYYELTSAGLQIERQKAVPVVYKEVKLDCGYRIDLLVENAIVVELKVADGFNPVHEAQILTYMKFAEKKTGLLINFNVTLLKNGIKRYVRW